MTYIPCPWTYLAEGSSWQLASGHWVARKFDAVIAHPRPTVIVRIQEVTASSLITSASGLITSAWLSPL